MVQGRLVVQDWHHHGAVKPTNMQHMHAACVALTIATHRYYNYVCYDFEILAY